MQQQNTESIIKLLKDVKGSIIEDRVSLDGILQRTKSVLERCYAPDSAFMTKAVHLEQSLNLLMSKKVDSIKMLPRCNTHDIAEDLRVVIESAIIELQAIGCPMQKKSSAGISLTANVSQNQSQNQSQKQQISLIYDILIGAIKDEITGKDKKELEDVINTAQSVEEAKSSIFNKILSWGENVSASILANILTNQRVWESLGSLM